MDIYRYQPNRLGLFNFWYHTDSVFEFVDGKLFVRGANGSGKSVTTTMAVPLLLDGDKSPNRLDPFGGRSRLMVDLLLGEKNISDKDEAIGYLYFEFKKGSSYLTLGIGMHGKRKERTCDYWYFIINDGRRIGKDFFLYSEENFHGEIKKCPLIKSKLEEQIGRGGEFTTSQTKYMEIVNQYLFGFDSVKTFKELIHILIQLRSPKLSRNTKPIDISNLLSDSLPELTDEDLSPMIQTIETIDAHQEKLQKLENTLKYLKELQIAYQTYNEYRAYGIAKENLEAEKQLDRAIQILKGDQRKLEQHKIELTELIEQLAYLETEKKVLDMEEENLKGHQVFSLRQQQSQYEEESLGLERSMEILDDKYYDTSIKLNAIIKVQKDNTFVKEKLKGSISLIIDELSGLCNQTFFIAHNQFLFHLEENKIDDLNIFRKNWEEELDTYQKALASILKLVQEVDICKAVEQEAEEVLDRVEQQLETIKQKERELQKETISIRENLDNNLLIWQAQAKVLVLEEKSKQELIGFLESFLYEEIEEAVQEIVLWCDKQKKVQEKLILQELEEYRFIIKEEGKIQANLNNQITEIESKSEIEPVYSKVEEDCHNALREQGVLFRKFFEAVDFHPEVDELTRKNIESVISRSGLLTALLVTEEDEDRVFELLPVLRTQQIKTQNLGKYLIAVPNEFLSQSRIERLLQGISIVKSDESRESYILNTGEFNNGFIHGKAPIQDELFIGKDAREVLRAKRILDLQSLVKSSINRIAEAEDRISFLENQIRLLDVDWSQFPCLTPMKEVEKQRRQLDTEKRVINSQIEKQAESLQLLKQNNQPIINKFLSASAPYHRIKRTSEAYQNIIDELNEYSKQLNDLFHLLSQRNMLDEKANYVLNNIMELENELAKLQDQKGNLHLDMKTKKAKLDTILNLIENQDSGQDILLRIDEIISKKKGNDEAARKGSERNGVLQLAITGFKEKIESQTPIILELEELKIAWESLFQEEKSFGFIEYHWTTQAAIRNLGPEYTDLNDSDVRDKLNRKIYDAECQLMDQGMKQIRRTLKVKKLGNGRNWDLIQQWSERQLVTFVPNYIEMNPAQLLAELQVTRDDTAFAIQEKERDLYEKVLIDDIGSTIRGLIEKAKDWEEEANYFLTNIDTTVRMKLKWKPLPAKEQGELSTTKLVELLSKKTQWLNNHDLELIREHFKRKVWQARKMAKEDTHFSLIIKMKELLDYRKWYRFVLYYQKDRISDFQEFTLNAFETMSGGEKGISMYSPLFAAAAAKYAHAAPYSPRLFSLDEAFAGIDHENIESIFDLISQFDFDYLMNSQILWGTYETVKKLSIVEILRRVHENTLALGRYYWDGENKHVLPKGHFVEEYFERKAAESLVAATSDLSE